MKYCGSSYDRIHCVLSHRNAFIFQIEHGENGRLNNDKARYESVNVCAYLGVPLKRIEFRMKVCRYENFFYLREHNSHCALIIYNPK